MVRESLSLDVGAVVIGRNEGERLERCLRSLRGQVAQSVYVDSGSTDASVARARELGAHVHELDPDVPFTAARARNAGARELLAQTAGLKWIQFVDGDCELAPGWIENGRNAFGTRPQCAVVCGRRRERFPEASVYNKLCDLEWDTPVGPAQSCGGDALVRVTAFEEVGGFRDDLIAGEEPEMCWRLRHAGWTIERIDAEMTLHDAAMTHVSQWWQRAKRCGYAWAEGYALHGAEDGYRRREVVSTLAWALGVPCASLSLAPLSGNLSLMGIAGYPALAAKVYSAARARGMSTQDARVYALSAVASKFPQAVGMLRYAWNRALRRRGTLIEYKGATSQAS